MAGFSISGLSSGVDWGALVDRIVEQDQNVLARTILRKGGILSAVSLVPEPL